MWARTVVAVAVLAAGYAAASPASAASAATPRRPAIPELIDAAQRGGRISADAAFVLRLKALRGVALPEAYRSTTPTDGTMMLLQMRRYLDEGGRARLLARGPNDPVLKMAKSVSMLGAFDPDLAPCANNAPQLQKMSTPHFRFLYTRENLGGGLTVQQYAAAFEQSWKAEITRDGWAAPPSTGANGGRYTVVIDQTLPPTFYGVTATTTAIGNNPATAWDDKDAFASCIVINGSFTPPVFTRPKAALIATAAHEFHHAVQFGMGVMQGGNYAELVFMEGLATWMEDQVFDTANDSYNYLWPDLTDNMALHSATPYGYFVVFQNFTERLGAEGLRMLQDFYALISQNRATNVHAMASALGSRGLQIGQAFHDAGIALAVLRPCGGAYATPYCFEEAPAYRRAAGPPRVNHVFQRNRTLDTTIEDNLAMFRGALPAVGSYGVTVSNRSGGGQLRVSVVCDTGQGLAIRSLPNLLGASASGTIPVKADGCTFVRLVVTNEALSAGVPNQVAARALRVFVN